MRIKQTQNNQPYQFTILSKPCLELLKFVPAKLWHLLVLLQAVPLNERSKRDASDASDASDSSSSSDESAESDSGSDESDVRATTAAPMVDECSLLGDYIEFEVAAIPPLEPRDEFSPPNPIDAPTSDYILFINETAPALLALLDATPSLFADLSQDINNVSAQVLDLDFLGDEILTIFRALAADFVAVANVSCGISLSPEQIANVTRLFDAALSSFLVASQECDLLNQTIIEDAFAAATVTSECTIDIQEALELENLFLLPERIVTGRINVFFPPPGETPVSAVQTALDEFVFYVTDFCGIPLGNDTLAQIDECFLRSCPAFDA